MFTSKYLAIEFVKDFNQFGLSFVYYTDWKFLQINLFGFIFTFNFSGDWAGSWKYPKEQKMSKCTFYDKEYKQDKKKYGDYNKMTTTCDICGKEIIGIENFIDAGDKVVCSENCKQTAIAEFRHWQETESHNWRRP